MLFGGGARAAEQAFNVDVSNKPLKAALVDFAIQTGISIGTGNVGECADRSVSLVGRYTPRAGLERILANSGCGYRQLDAQAFDIVRLRPARAPSPPPRAPAPPVPPSAPDLSELVVVATRRPTPADRLAYAVSAYNQNALSAEGVGDTSDLALVTPAMTVTNLGMGRDKILLRGISDGPLTGQAQSMVGLYLDDTRLTYNAPDPDLRLVDIARVEVLRGPQGALYGAGSLGGVLHMVTAQPDPTHFAASVTAGFGATQDGADSQALDAVVNAPLFFGRGAVRVVLYRERQGGYMSDAALGVPNANASVREGERLAVAFEPNPRWTISAGLVSQAINSADTQYALAGDPAYTRFNRVREPHDNDFSAYHVTAQGELGWGQLRWSTSYVQHSLFSRYDATSAPPVPVPSGPAAFDETDDIKTLLSEATLSTEGGAPIQWIAGAFYAHTLQTTLSTLTVLNTPSVLAFEAVRHNHLDEGAVFGEVTVPLTSAISLTIGGRAFVAPTRVSSTMHALLSGAADTFSGGAGRPGFAPKFVLAYRPSSVALVYVQAAEGYRSDGVNTTGPPGQVFSKPGGLEPNRIFQGDELWSLEAGGRLKLYNGRLRLQLTAFDAFWKNIQSDQLLASGLPFTANIGDGRNSGFEFEGGYRFGALELNGEFLMNTPELSRANPAFSAQSELNLSAVPNRSFGVSTHYAWVLGRDYTLAFDGRWTYIGVSRLVLGAGMTSKMGDYATGRLAATLADKRWRLTMALDNPAGARGDTFAYGNPFMLPTMREVTPLRPRTVSIALTVSY